MLLCITGMVVDYLMEANKTTLLRYDGPTNQCILCLKLDAFRDKCTSVKLITTIYAINILEEANH